jgi:alpha-L-rhamnosidase
MLDLLTEKGREDIVWDMALKTDFPSWGYSLRNGRTTITEAWKDGGSQNHVVLGAAIDPWFYHVLGGIKMDEKFPGFKRFVIDPFIPEDQLDWVQSSVQTIYGKIASSWKKGPDGLIMDVSVPANTTAIVHLPFSTGDTITEGGKPVSRRRAIRTIAETEDEMVVEVGSGDYSFRLSNSKE